MKMLWWNNTLTLKPCTLVLLLWLVFSLFHVQMILTIRDINNMLIKKNLYSNRKHFFIYITVNLISKGKRNALVSNLTKMSKTPKWHNHFRHNANNIWNSIIIFYLHKSNTNYLTVWNSAVCFHIVALNKQLFNFSYLLRSAAHTRLADDSHDDVIVRRMSWHHFCP